MRRQLVVSVVVGCTCGALSPLARANDTDLTYGGTPRPLTGNTTVSMRDERVTVQVGNAVTTVDCRFTFRNSGPACKVRMGFPDEGGEPGESIDPKTNKPFPRMPSITDFRSWVNGKRAKTTATPVDDTGSFWHVKMVTFAANSTVTVRDRYTVPVGNSVAYYPLSVRMAKYVLHTGASWHGTILRSEVDVIFRRRGVPSPISARPIPARYDAFRKHASVGAHYVYYSGPCKPTVAGSTLRFVRTNWRPKMSDDILLLFNVKRGPASG